MSPARFKTITAVVLTHRRGITMQDVVGQQRTADIVRARHEVAALTRIFTEMSTTSIGEKLGGRDHTTIMSGLRKIARRIDADPDYADHFEALKREIVEANTPSINNVLYHRLPAFIQGLTGMTATETADAFMNETIESGGTYVAPNPTDPRASHMFELSLHGISAHGTDEAQAIHNWTRMAKSQIDQATTSNNGGYFPPWARPPLTA